MKNLDSYLPDECWESIFKFININNDDENFLNSLSLVSKQFLSITNCLRFSLSLKDATRPFLPSIFKRFTNLTSLDLTHFCDDRNLDDLLTRKDHDLDDLLTQISKFPLKLTSLKLPGRCRFPANGLQAFSQNITTLTSLTCYRSYILSENDFSPIVNCFPLLEELNLQCPTVHYIYKGNFIDNETNFVNTIHRLLSKSPCIQHLDLYNTYFLNDQHIVDFSLFLGNLVSINLSHCWLLTETTLFYLVRNCPSLCDIKMEIADIGKGIVTHSDSLVEFGVYPQLKSLYLAYNSWLSDEIIILFASIFPNLELLDLGNCYNISEGICQVLRKCCKLKHLNLASCSKVKLHGMNFVVPELEVLNLSDTKVNDKTLYAISVNCCGLLKLQLDNCKSVTETGVKHVIENCKELREINLAGLHLSDKNRKLFSRHGCHIC